MKCSVIALLIAFYQNAYACRIDMSVAKEISKNPQIAKMIVVGTGEDLGKEGGYGTYLIVDKKWTNSLPRFLVGHPFEVCNSVIVQSKKRYLLLNETPVVSEKKPRGIEAARSVLVELSESQPYIDKLALIKNIPDNQPNPSWEYCKESLECAATTNVCGDSVGVNKKYQVNYEQFVKNFKGPKECSGPRSLTNNLKLKCIDYFCAYEK